MPRPPKPFAVYRRSGYRTFQLTLSPTCGLPAPVCRQWKRRSFQDFPPELAQHRLPQTKTAAQAGALALIEFLKKTDEPIRTPVDRISVGAWLEKFTRMEGNPKAALNEAKNRPYSLNTISRYEGLYRVYIKNDPFAALPMAELDEADALEFARRCKRRYGGSGRKTAGMNLCSAIRTAQLRGRRGSKAGLKNGWPGLESRQGGGG